MVTTNSLTGYKLYISSDQKNLKTSDGLSENAYDNLTTGSIQKTDLSANTWGIFMKKNGQDYVLPLCQNEILKEACLISESTTPVTNHATTVEYGTHIRMDTWNL